MKHIILTFILAIAALTIQAQVKCKVIGIVAEGTTPKELVIYHDGEDPKNSSLRPEIKDGHFECEVEDAQIEMYKILDFGEVLDKGFTERVGEFFVEDGATINVQLDGDEIIVSSTGKEFQAKQTMRMAAEDEFSSAFESLDESDSAKVSALEQELAQWTLDYYAAHPMLAFLLELSGRLQGFYFNDTELAPMLDIYHQKYENLYPNHSVHRRIVELENSGLQICGRKYNDYNIRTMDGEKVSASDYYKGRLTIVVCWASWCAPCIRHACEIIPLYEKYHERGLNVFSIAHEFKSTDDMRKIVERYKYPWQCFADVDDEFGVFKMHGTSNSALFLVNRDGIIIAVSNNVNELKMKLVEFFGE